MGHYVTSILIYSKIGIPTFHINLDREGERESALTFSEIIDTI